MYKVLSIVVIVLGFCVPAIIAYTTVSYVEFTVNSKESIRSGESHKYLIFTDKGVYQNTDCPAYLKFNSSDVYNGLCVGKTYKAKVYGFRISFFSMYKNIVSVSEVKSE